MLKALLGLLSGLPDLLSLIKTLSSSIVSFIEEMELKKKSKEMDKALEESKKTGDTSGIEDLFNGKK